MAGHSVVVVEMVVDLDDAPAVLAASSGERRRRMVAERDVLVTAVRDADLRNGDTVRSTSGQVLVQVGGLAGAGAAGAARWARDPVVAEFAAADVAAELERSPFAARAFAR